MKLFEGCWRCMVAGFVFGVLSVAVMAFGVGGAFVERIFYNVVLIPEIISSLLFGDSVISLGLVSGVFYAFIGYLIKRVLNGRNKLKVVEPVEDKKVVKKIKG